MSEKLTPAQKSALSRIPAGEWVSAYDIQASLATLDALVRKGRLEHKAVIGYLFSPRTGHLYRRKQAALTAAGGTGA